MANIITSTDRAEADELRRARSLLWEGITQDHIHLHIQPIFQACDRIPAFWEVLVRIEDEQGEIHRPVDFLDQSERLDLGGSLDRIIINEAMRRWKSYSHTVQSTPIAINVSANSANADMAQYVIDCAAHWRMPHAQLMLEIPSSTVAENRPEVRQFIASLSAEGFGLAVDGFDGGAALLGIAADLDFDILKLDGSLTQRIVSSQPHRQYVCSLISLAHTNELEVVAQFIENDELLNAMREIGADYVQGNHLSAPTEFPLE